MKAVLLTILIFSFNAFSQDVNSQLAILDSKIYSLKSKGVSDFVVNIKSSRLTKQVNDQLIFGKIKNLVFRAYWTAKPERLAIDIIGLPEGFKEIKDDLKANMLVEIENILPISTLQKFAGYKISAGSKSKEYFAKDTSGLAAIPSFEIKYDAQDKLIQVVANKPVGTFLIDFIFSKESFSDGKWVLNSSDSVGTENGQTIRTKKKLSYGQSHGIGVLKDVEITTEQTSEIKGSKSLNSQETLQFSNYKINAGEGLKHFLHESKN